MSLFSVNDFYFVFSFQKFDWVPWTSLSLYYLEFTQFLESIGLCLSLNLENFQPFFRWILFQPTFCLFLLLGESDDTHVRFFPFRGSWYHFFQPILSGIFPLIPTFYYWVLSVSLFYLIYFSFLQFPFVSSLYFVSLLRLSVIFIFSSVCNCSMKLFFNDFFKILFRWFQHLCHPPVGIC